MEFQIYTGESIENALSALGINAKFIKHISNCTTTKYHFDLKDFVQESKINNAIKFLSMKTHAPIKYGYSKIADFCLEMPNKERFYPTYDQTWYGINNYDCAAISFGYNEDMEILTRKLEDLPHMLVAGSTGSGKSIFLNNVISNLHYRDDCALVLIDPKQVEFSQFANSHRLYMPIITEVDDAISVLHVLCNEMDERYKQLKACGMRDNSTNKFCKIVIVVDELADLMLTSKYEVEESIVRLAQKGRAAGMHLILATQRPTVNVVTGLIQANIPCRVCFTVAKVRDSVVMLDKGGAEKLLGKGDCLIKLPDRSELVRIQAPYISMEDIKRLMPNKPREWKNEYNRKLAHLPPLDKTTPTSHKTSWLDKLLGKLGFDRSRPQRMRNLDIYEPEPQVPYNIDEQNFFDCMEDDEEE